MLYIAPLFNELGLEKTRFGYADDVALLEVSPSLPTNIERLTASLQQALLWGEEEGISFDPEKSELIHFTRKRNEDSRNQPVISLNPDFQVGLGDKPYLKWLGVLFDQKLTFKYHVTAQVEKAIKVARALSSLGNTVRGLAPKLLRLLIVACVFPIATYGAET